MPRPCPQALSTFSVPARRFRTRAELVELVEQARAHLDGQLSMVSLKDLATHVGLTPYHLQRTFLEVVGQSPANYHAVRRFDRAKAELLNGVAADDIAEALGYADLSAFSKAFRRQVGMPPGQFRKIGQPSAREPAID